MNLRKQRYRLFSHILWGKKKRDYRNKYLRMRNAKEFLPPQFEETEKLLDSKSLLIVNTDSIGDYILLRNLLYVIRNSKKYKDYHITFLGSKKYQKFASYLDADVADCFLWTKHSPEKNSEQERENDRKELKQQGLKSGYHTILFLSINSIHKMGAHAELLKGISCVEKIIPISYVTPHRNPLIWETYTYVHVDYAICENPGDHFVFNFYKRFLENVLEEPISLKWPVIEPEKIEFSFPLLRAQTGEYVVINPCAQEKLRMWHPNNWLKIMRYMSECYGYTIVLVCSGVEERKYCEKLLKTFGKSGYVFSDLAVKDLLAVLKLSKLYIGQDSGIFHVAAALKIRTLCISSGISYYRFLTYGKENKHIRIVFPRDTLRWLTQQRELSPSRGYFCINQLHVSDVQQAIDELLEIKEIIFVHKLRTQNTGDRMICPLDIFKSHFEHMPFIIQKFDNDELPILGAKKAIFVLGGGGMINQNNPWNAAINHLILQKNLVIGWGIGFNQHYNRPVNTTLLLNQFSLLGIRDFGKTYRYVPCPSCMLEAINLRKSIQRRIGAVIHYENIIDTFGFETMYNNQPFDEIIKFIAESEVILTNTYHIVYWSTLMRKKVILLSKFSDKFDSFKYPPTLYSGNLEEDIKRAKIYPQALEECRTLNKEFFRDLKKIL